MLASKKEEMCQSIKQPAGFIFRLMVMQKYCWNAKEIAFHVMLLLVEMLAQNVQVTKKTRMIFDILPPQLSSLDLPYLEGVS